MSTALRRPPAQDACEDEEPGPKLVLPVVDAVFADPSGVAPAVSSTFMGDPRNSSSPTAPPASPPFIGDSKFNTTFAAIDGRCEANLLPSCAEDHSRIKNGNRQNLHARYPH